MKDQPKYICPSCRCSNFRVIDSRPYESVIKRRRLCKSCGYKFNTYEIDEELYNKTLAIAANKDLIKKVCQEISKHILDSSSEIIEQVLSKI